MKRFVSVLLLLVMMTTCLTVHAESEPATEDKGTAATVVEEEVTSQEETVQPKSDKAIHLVQWDESIELDFIHLNIKKAKIYRVPEQAIRGYEGNYKLRKGKQYFMLVGTVKNVSDQSLALKNVFSTVRINDQVYKMESAFVAKNAAQSTSSIDAGASGTFLLIAEIPEQVAKEMKTAVVEFSFRNGMSAPVSAFGEGDHLYRAEVDTKEIKAARKADERKKKYITVGDKKTKLLAPESFVDARDDAENITTTAGWRLLTPIAKKKYSYDIHYYYPRFSDETAGPLVKGYIKALKKNGYTVARVKALKINKGYDKKVTYYSITKDKKVVGWIEYDTRDESCFRVGGIK